MHHEFQGPGGHATRATCDYRQAVCGGLLHQDLITRVEVLADGHLPPVLPIVLHSGSPCWSAMSDVFDLITPVPALVEQFKPRLKYPLIDKSALSDSELASLTNLVAAVFRIEHPASLDAIGGLAEPARRVAGRAARPTPDVRAVDRGHMWIEATLMPKAEDRIVLPRIEGLPELNVMLAERLEEWAHAYKAEGKAKGKAEGEALALQKVIKKRFGAVPAEVLAKISAASLEQIDAWLDQVLDAHGLDDIFGPSTC